MDIIKVLNSACLINTFYFLYLFVLAVSGLSCGTWNPHCGVWESCVVARGHL